MIVYYLLYNIVNTDKLWVLDIDTNYNILYNKIRDFKSIHERYYIIEKITKKRCLSEKIKSFTLYNKNKQDTNIIKYITGLTCRLNDQVDFKIKNKSNICTIM
tara:strand:+ start:25 stop:333 length:309 start_codon:yes stop_codon:yes gene_type:complete